MEIARSGPGQRPAPDRIPLPASTVFLLAIACGLAGGYLDVAIIIFKRYCCNPEGYFRIASDFPWSVPLAHAALMALTGLAVGIASRLAPGGSRCARGCGSSAPWGSGAALLRLPLYGWASLLMAAGLGRLIGDAAAARGLAPRFVPRFLAAMLGVLAALAAVSTGREALAEARAVGRLPTPPPRARNVVLIVWDTVAQPELDPVWLPSGDHP